MFTKLWRRLQSTTTIRQQLHVNDPLGIADLLTKEELDIQAVAEKVCRDKLLPTVKEAFRKEHFDRNIMRELGSLGLLGCTLQEFGGVSSVGYGLIAKALESVDSGYRSAVSVQSSLVMFPLATFGSADVKEKWLEKLSQGEAIGCFGLTEPGAGSDPGSMLTHAVDHGTHWTVSGTKTWITNSPIADVMIVWARDKQSGKLRGFVLERGMEGLETPKIEGKVSLRASCTGMIMMDNVKVPKENVLNVEGFKGPFECLNNARYGIGWGAWGAAQSCVDVTLAYVKEREQFGRPLAQNQLIQAKLANAVSEIGLGLLAGVQVGHLKDQGKVIPEQISILKRNACGKSIKIARDCRDMLGGNGISDEYHVIRHLVNLEAVNTYEGTFDIHSLIIGRSITGLSAF